jgi:hypothetical protein
LAAYGLSFAGALVPTLALPVPAQNSESAARDVPPHLHRSSPNLAPNPPIQGEVGWNLRRGAIYDAKMSRKSGSGSFDLSKPDSQVQSEFIPVTAGKTYTYAAYMRTSKWPALAYMQIAVYDSANRFKYNWQGSYQATTTHDAWQETVILFSPGDGDARIRLTYGRLPQSKSPRSDGQMWVDDFYFGEGVGFEQPPTAKKPFAGSKVRIDALGNFEILREGKWQPFFPFAIYRHARRPDFQVYSDKGFNCIFANNFSLDILQRAKNAVSKFNPDGMFSGIDIEQYLDKRQPEFKDLTGLRKNLSRLLESPLLDQVLAFYWDNEQYDQFDLPREACKAIQEADVDQQGRRRHPVFMLHGNQGLTRSFASLADVTGDYLRDRRTQSYLGPQQTTRQRFAVLDNLQQQRIPPAIGIISEEETAEGVRRLVYEHLMAGGKGIAYFRDGAFYDYNGDRNSPAAKDVTLRKCWSEFPKLRAEIDHLMPLIRRPHWTAWKLTTPESALEWGTRDYQNEGYVLLLNPARSDVTATFAIHKLDYAAASAVDYFTGEEIAPVRSAKFTITLPANQTAILRLARSR